MLSVQYRSQIIDDLGLVAGAWSLGLGRWGLVAGMCKELGIAEHIDKFTRPYRRCLNMPVLYKSWAKRHSGVKRMPWRLSGNGKEVRTLSG